MTQRGRNSRKFSHYSNMTRRGSHSLILICAYLAFIAATVAVDQGESANDGEDDARGNRARDELLEESYFEY